MKELGRGDVRGTDRSLPPRDMIISVGKIWDISWKDFLRGCMLHKTRSQQIQYRIQECIYRFEATAICIKLMLPWEKHSVESCDSCYVWFDRYLYLAKLWNPRLYLLIYSQFKYYSLMISLSLGYEISISRGVRWIPLSDNSNPSSFIFKFPFECTFQNAHIATNILNFVIWEFSETPDPGFWNLDSAKMTEQRLCNISREGHELDNVCYFSNFDLLPHINMHNSIVGVNHNFKSAASHIIHWCSSYQDPSILGMDRLYSLTTIFYCKCGPDEKGDHFENDECFTPPTEIADILQSLKSSSFVILKAIYLKTNDLIVI